MEEVTLAFYVGKGKLIDKLIRWVTKSKFSHVALVVRGLCVEADAWNAHVIVRPWAYNTADWELVKYPVSDVNKVWKFCTTTAGNRYDYLGALGWVFPFKPQISQWWFCSEHVATALGLAKTSVSPGELYCMVTSCSELK